MSRLPQLVEQKTVEFLGYTLHFNLLDDGRKIIDQDDVRVFVDDMLDGKIEMTDEDVDTLRQYIHGEGL